MKSSSAEHHANRIRAEMDQDLSVDIEAVAGLLGCRVEEASLLSHTRSVEADLTPDPIRDHFLIRVDPTPRDGWGGTAPAVREDLARHRRRFRIAHECGHCLSYERGRDHGPRRRRPPSETEEKFCDDFARALLIPPQAAKAAHFSAASTFKLQARFDTSLEVAARALAAAHPEGRLALWYWPSDRPARPEELLLQWSNFADQSLQRWRESALIGAAIAKGGEAEGMLPRLGRRASGTLPATARSEPSRHQVVATVP